MARFADCAALGQRVLMYLRSGDNGGDPTLDVQYANSVGAPLPQARAVADDAITQCDNDNDDAVSPSGVDAPGSSPELDGTAVENEVSAVVTQSYGDAPSSAVHCPDRIPVVVGGIATCTLTVDGTQKSVIVTVTDAVGTFEVGRPG